MSAENGKHKRTDSTWCILMFLAVGGFWLYQAVSTRVFALGLDGIASCWIFWLGPFCLSGLLYRGQRLHEISVAALVFVAVVWLATYAIQHLDPRGYLMMFPPGIAELGASVLMYSIVVGAFRRKFVTPEPWSSTILIATVCSFTYWYCWFFFQMVLLAN